MQTKFDIGAYVYAVRKSDLEIMALNVTDLRSEDGKVVYICKGVDQTDWPGSTQMAFYEDELYAEPLQAVEKATDLLDAEYADRRAKLYSLKEKYVGQNAQKV